MKKIIVALLATAALLCMAGCRPTDRDGTDLLPSGNIHTEFPGMTVSIAEINTHDGVTQLDVLWRNKTPYDVIYGESYVIERLEGNQWVRCETENGNIVFRDIGYELKAGEKISKTYTASNLFDISLPGTYRFRTSCHVYINADVSIPCELTAEFTVAAASQTEPLFQTPPEGTLITPDGRYPLTLGGYNWTYETTGGKAVTSIADQTSRPLPADSLGPISIGHEHATSVYAYYPKTGGYELTDHQGFLVQLYFENAPTSITYQCWEDAVWELPYIQANDVEYFREEPAFYAKWSGYIYEITATWEDTGRGYHGTANYYVYIVAGDDLIHQVPTQAQTADDPVTGYCGNTWTTLYIDGKEYGFMGCNSVALTDLLVNLNYDPNKVCRCMPQYKADTEFGTNYHIHLDYAFVRCDKGQAELTAKQVEQISAIIELAKEGMPKK